MRKQRPTALAHFVVMGVVAVLSFHILVNVGMVVGFMPVTGIPLPLNELRRVFRFVHVLGAGYCNERSNAPLRELNREDGKESIAALAPAAEHKITIALA